MGRWEVSRKEGREQPYFLTMCSKITVGMMVRVTTFPALARISVTSLSWKGGKQACFLYIILGGTSVKGSAWPLLEDAANT